MNVVDNILLHFDNAWDHEWESLMGTLSGVTEAEAQWQAPCYDNAPGADGAPAPGTIRWHVTHVANCKREYTSRLNGDQEARSPDISPRLTKSLAEDLEELRSAHTEQRTAIAALSADELTPTLADFLANIIRHDIWHGGQIALARRLWRSRSE